MSTTSVYPGSPVAETPEPFALPHDQRAIIRWMIYIGFAALAVGIINGLGQALNYAGVDILKYFPGMRTYYQGLTVHGVFNAIVLTFTFTNGFLSLTTARGFGRRLNGGLLWATLLATLGGVALAAFAMFTGRASVLYTFYAPLQAHWTFYLGLALLVISTWLTSLNMFLVLRAWRRDHPGERIPLLSYISIATYVMWDLASVGIAVEVVGFLLPWSLGLFPRIDPLLTRTLFWFSGHPIVYFWLLPAYVSWYAMVPHQAGGKLWSDSLTRLVFALFILLSIPTGFHHQYTDPGISSTMKLVHGAMTFGVFFPSVITAFSLLAALELAGRKRGATGVVDWFFKLPWGDPSLAAQLLAMLVFVLGGITGLVNASYAINRVIHNTAWVPGHFHMTVGTAVALTFMGIAYWLIPWLTDRELWGRRVALAQVWLYFIGVLIFARGMISGGLEGMPRRTMILAATYSKPSWHLAGILTGVGGSLMFASGMLFFLVIAVTILFGRRLEGQTMPLTETISPPATSGWTLQLDRFGLLAVVAIVLILIAYAPFFIHYLPPKMGSEPFKLF